MLTANCPALASQSFNKHTGGTGVKWGLLQSTLGRQVIDDLKSFVALPFFLNFYDSMVIVGLHPYKTTPCKNLIL